MVKYRALYGLNEGMSVDRRKGDVIRRGETEAAVLSSLGARRPVLGASIPQQSRAA